jgi:hypothetical protein
MHSCRAGPKSDAQRHARCRAAHYRPHHCPLILRPTTLSLSSPNRAATPAPLLARLFTFCYGSRVRLCVTRLMPIMIGEARLAIRACSQCIRARSPLRIVHKLLGCCVTPVLLTLHQTLGIKQAISHTPVSHITGNELACPLAESYGWPHATCVGC